MSELAPVVVIPVPTLPRNASVEVELIVAATSIKAQKLISVHSKWTPPLIEGLMNVKRYVKIYFEVKF